MMDRYLDERQVAAFRKLLELLQCPICQQPMTEPYVTDCEHDFCKPCIEKYVHKTNECPVCKVTVVPRDIQRNHTLNNVAKAFAQMNLRYEEIQNLLPASSLTHKPPDNDRIIVAPLKNEVDINHSFPSPTSLSPCETAIEPSIQMNLDYSKTDEENKSVQRQIDENNDGDDDDSNPRNSNVDSKYCSREISKVKQQATVSVSTHMDSGKDVCESEREDEMPLPKVREVPESENKSQTVTDEVEIGNDSSVAMETGPNATNNSKAASVESDSKSKRENEIVNIIQASSSSAQNVKVQLTEHNVEVYIQPTLEYDSESKSFNVTPTQQTDATVIDSSQPSAINVSASSSSKNREETGKNQFLDTANIKATVVETETTNGPLGGESSYITASIPASIPTTQQLEAWGAALKDEAQEIHKSDAQKECGERKQKVTPVVSSSRLSPSQQQEVMRVCKDLGWEFIDTITYSNVIRITHLLLDVNDTTKPLKHTPKSLIALCKTDCYILKYEWVEACACLEAAAEEEPFYVFSKQLGTFQQRNKLMEGQLIYLAMNAQINSQKSLEYDIVKRLLEFTGAKVKDLCKLVTEFSLIDDSENPKQSDYMDGKENSSNNMSGSSRTLRKLLRKCKFSANEMISTVERPVILAQHQIVNPEAHCTQTCRQCKIWAVLLRTLKAPILDPIWLVESIKENTPQSKAKFCISQHLMGV